MALLLCWSLPPRARAAAGDLDPTFGVGGKVTTSFFNDPNGNFGEEARDVAVQPDGKIVVVCTLEEAGTGFRPNFGLVRYRSDGSLDTGFGSGGKVNTGFDVGATPFALALQADGKILVAGGARQFNQQFNTSFAVARYNTDGSLDSGFGVGGKVITTFADNDDSLVTAVLPQPDGKIVVTGRALLPLTTYDFALARYNADGSLDVTFGTGGKVTTNFFGNGDLATTAGLGADGKIVVAGLVINARGGDDFGLARYNPDGSLDSTFGAGGKVVTDIAGAFDIPRSLAIQGDGKIIAAGSAVVGPEGKTVFVRYATNGGLDATFGTGGLRFDDSLLGPFDVTIQPDGKIVAGGIAVVFETQDFGVARYNSDGSTDFSFGLGGRVTTDFLANTDWALAVALQPDGKIVAAGRAFDLAANSDYIALARYNGDAPSFDFCVQDDSNGNLLQFSSATGDYRFTRCGGGGVLDGKGSVTRRGSVITLQHYSTAGKVQATVDGGTNRGSATIQSYSLGATFTITDRNTTNNTCACR